MGDLVLLRNRLEDLAPVVVAFSGGADSAFLAWVAHDTLGPERATSVTAVSPSLAGFEHQDCAALAAEWGLDWLEVITDEMHNAAYQRNDADRCFWCKDALMDAVAPLTAVAGARPGATFVLGVNVDDLGDHRPGQRAAAAKGARFPLVDAGFTKADVRAWSEALGLRTHGKAGGALPGVAHPLRRRGLGAGARSDRARRGGAARPRVPPAAGPPLRRLR